MNNNEWGLLWGRLQQRWPDWSPTPVESADWKEYLSNKDPLFVEIAATNTVAKFSSPKPRLAWVLRQHDEIVRNRDKQEAEMQAAKEEVEEAKSLERTMELLAEEDDMRIEELRNLPVETRRVLIETLHAKNMLAFEIEAYGDDPSEWSRNARGFALALWHDMA